MSEGLGWIYRIVNGVNGKCYIGQTSMNDCRERIGDHFKSLRGGRHRNNHLQSSFCRHGGENFSWEIIDIAGGVFTLDRLEQFWIEKYNSMDSRFGYNKESGGNRHKKLSTETREKLSQYNKKLSEKMTPEERKERYGRPMTEEQKLNHSLRMKGRAAWNKGKSSSQEPWNKGKANVYSEETLTKMSEAKKGKPGNNKGYSKYKIQVLNLETMETTIYSSAYECADAIGVTYSGVKSAIRNGARSYKGKYQIKHLSNEG